MSFATSNAADVKRLRFKVVFDRDVTATVLQALDATTGWTAFADAHNIAADTSDYTNGTGSLKWNKTSTTSANSRLMYAYTATQDWSAYDAFSVDVRCTAADDANTDIKLSLLASTSTTTNYERWDVGTAYLRRGWARLSFAASSPSTTVGTLSMGSIMGVSFGWGALTGTRGYTWIDNFCGLTYGSSLPVFANGTMQSATSSNIKYHLKRIGPIGGTVEPNRPERSQRGVTIDLVDVDGDVTQMLYDFEMRNRAVSIYAGYDDVDEPDYVLLYRGQVSSMAWRDGVWSFTCGDIRRSLKSSVFTAAATTAVEWAGINPIEAMLRVWTNASTNGIAIDPEEIDWDTINTLNDDYFSALTMDFDIREPWEAKDFVEKQIAGPLGCYLTVSSAGKLSLAYVHAPLLAEASGTTITASEIIGVPSIEYGLRDLLNEIFWQVDYDADTDAYTTKTMYVDSTSLTKFSQSKRFTVESRGLDASDSVFITGRNTRMFARFAEPYPRYRVRTKLSCCQIREGTLIQITHPKLPSIATGDRGMDTSHLVEVLGASVDLAGGFCEFDLLETPWSFTNTVVISALDVDYDSATADQHTTYGWISDGSDNVGVADDDGYVIQEG